MKKLLSATLLTVFLLLSVCYAKSDIEYYPVDIPLKKLLKVPSPEADVSLEFPINVKITGVSKDKKWYKVHISYDLVFFGKYTFNGWVYADVFNSMKTVTTEALP